MFYRIIRTILKTYPWSGSTGGGGVGSSLPGSGSANTDEPKETKNASEKKTKRNFLKKFIQPPLFFYLLLYAFSVPFFYIFSKLR